MIASPYFNCYFISDINNNIAIHINNIIITYNLNESGSATDYWAKTVISKYQAWHSEIITFFVDITFCGDSYYILR